MLDNKYERVVILEDDVRFEPYFRTKLTTIMHEVKAFFADWDLM